MEWQQRGLGVQMLEWSGDDDGTFSDSPGGGGYNF